MELTSGVWLTVREVLAGHVTVESVGTIKPTGAHGK
jgi:hypothetical protein